MRCDDGEYKAEWQYILGLECENQRLSVGECVAFNLPCRTAREARGICVIPASAADDPKEALRLRQEQKKAFRRQKGELVVARARHRKAERTRIQDRIAEITEFVDGEPSGDEVLADSFAERARARRGE